ncbi:OLC1v1008440C1 [Oldenlandia corymbosa var. corymbosa]|uniref:OLC1v1008440C1 n=1 Tax=Oldenlandia corymbosa var. corymbosa TaxID=529605 RepID=A0AAV1DLZ3_OLDCO|nr:OLC1v1008440C1 [Oldenlandia corymbosa var. corymbosa]
MGLIGSDERVFYKPVDEVDLGADSKEIYIRANVKAPRMAGLLVKVFVWLLESRFLGAVILHFLKKNNLIHKLVSYAELQESPLFVPFHPYEGTEVVEEYIQCDHQSPEKQVQQATLCVQSPENTLKTSPNFSFQRWTIMDYARAYKSREITPLMVAEKLIEAVRESSKPSIEMSFFISFEAQDILNQASESTLRYERGEPISVLDGIPVAIKDEIDCLPYPTTGGTQWMHKVRSCKEDACCVERLRLCGALLVGKTNMHELGAGTSGINPHYGTTRNPHDRSTIAGGSSSGSAAVVCAGLCPAALGVDGGGSVRMPAALCGVVGLKPTFGRVPHNGVLPLNWTVGMVGILAGTVEDALIIYAAIGGPLPSDRVSHTVPNVCLPLLKLPNYNSSIKLARYGEWFNDSNDDIRICCSNALAKLHDEYGWKTIEVTIPDIEAMRLAHYLTIGSECSTSIAHQLEMIDKAELGWDARVALSVYGAFNSREYLNAQKMRHRQFQIHKKIFSKADVIVTPTTGVTAYPIQDDALSTGELDYINGAALVRYQIAGNFLGLPAVTVPVGYDKHGLPIGLQFIGKPWSEALLIHIAFAMQALCMSDYKKPEVYYDLLTGK